MNHRDSLKLALLGVAALIISACAAKNEQCSSDLTVDCSSGGSSSSTSSTSTSSSSSGDGGASSSGDAGTSSGSTSSGDGGTSSSGDGGSTSSGGTGAFAGAPAYVQGTSQINSKGGVHSTANAARGLACLQCHVAGGQASNLQFVLGGTVYTDVGGTVAAGPGVEVRIVDGANKAVSVYTDAYVNFAASGANAPTFPWKVGVRNASTAVSMSATVTSGNCAGNGCHTGAGGATARIHIP